MRFAERLRALMAERGFSGLALARKVHCDQAYISRLSTGKQQPSPKIAQLLDDALGAGGALASLVASSHRASPSGALTGPPGERQTEPWELADALTKSPLSGTALDFMEQAITGFAARYPYTAPADLAPGVQRMLARVKDALSRSQPVNARIRCVRLAGVLSGVAGQLADDMGHHGQAGGYYDAGQLAADEIGDRDLRAWLLAVRSIGVFFRGGYHAAVAMLGQAQTAATNSTPRRRAWLDALSARALAAVAAQEGSQEVARWDVLANLGRAHDHLAGAVGPLRETEFFDRPRLSGMAGSTLLLLRDTRNARDLLADALANRSAADVKGRALLTLDLAECAAADGEPEEAARLGNGALDTLGGAVVQPVLIRTRQLRHALHRWENTPAVRDLGSRMAEISRYPRTEG